MASKLQVIPLGGLGEFGMNSLALRFGDDILVIDAGMMFPDEDWLGIDIVVPDFQYLLENREHVRALLLTHGHEDHIGAVPFLLSKLDLPVYGTSFTLALAERRLEEHELAGKARLYPVKPGEKVEIGPFQVEFIHVTHSVVQSTALAIRTPLGVVIHTGDFKVDPTPTDNVLFDLHTLADYGKEGVLLLLSDSTNVDRPGYTESERAVRPRFEDVLNRAQGRVVISCFSSSIHRLQQVFELAEEYGRKVALIGRSMLEVTEIAHRLGVLHIPDHILLRPQDVMLVPRNRVVVLASGSQGEALSAMARIAVDNHKYVSLEPGDVVVLSARIIPGNEKAIYRMINHIARRGADVLYGSMNPPVHVSGHASSGELKLVLNLVRPRYFVPIHGEYRQLAKHVALAQSMRHAGLEECFIIESGQVLEIDEAGARIAGTVPVGRLCIDAGTLDEVVEDMVIKDRRRLSEEGFVVSIVLLNRATGRAESPPEIVSRGFVSEEGSGLLEQARNIVIRTLESSSPEERTDIGLIQEKIRRALRKFFDEVASAHPLILPVVLEV